MDMDCRLNSLWLRDGQDGRCWSMIRSLFARRFIEEALVIEIGKLTRDFIKLKAFQKNVTLSITNGYFR